MKVNCVIVTYNRLSLLKECLEAVKQQTFPINQTIIVDNCSTDETGDFLKQFENEENIQVIRTEKNIGGAGGFSLGLKSAVMEGCDFTWLMDDDTIPTPTALEELIKVAAEHPNTGFVCSRVNWTNGEEHIMNRPNLFNNEILKNKQRIPAVHPCRTCSFVSVLINSTAVYRLGLPIKEFFIWCDDIEYTERISKSGYPCYYTDHSIALHKTAVNYFPSIDKAPASMATRFYYQARNTSYLKRKSTSNRIFFYLAILNKYRVYKHKLNKHTDGDKKAFLDAVKRGCKDGLTFNPQIEYIEQKK